MKTKDMYLNSILIYELLSNKAIIQLKEFHYGLVFRNKISNKIPKITEVMKLIMIIITVNQMVKTYHFV